MAVTDEPALRQATPKAPRIAKIPSSVTNGAATSCPTRCRPSRMRHCPVELLCLALGTYGPQIDSFAPMGSGTAPVGGPIRAERQTPNRSATASGEGAHGGRRGDITLGHRQQQMRDRRGGADLVRNLVTNVASPSVTRYVTRAPGSVDAHAAATSPPLSTSFLANAAHTVRTAGRRPLL